MFSIESVKKTNVPSGLYWLSQPYYHLCLWEIIAKREKSLINVFISNLLIINGINVRAPLMMHVRIYAYKYILIEAIQL